MDLQTLEIGKHVLAGFFNKLKYRTTPFVYTHNKLIHTIENPPTTTNMSIISQQDIFTNLKNFLEAYNYQNNLIGSQVSVCMKVYNTSMNFTLYIATIKWKYI